MLSPTDKQALMDASKKAQQDPAVQAADVKRHTAMKAVYDAMEAKDKSYAPLVDKIEAAATSNPPTRMVLTDDEKAQLMAGRKLMMGTPEAMELQEANAQYYAVLRKTMVASDPAVASIFAKLPQPGAPHGAGGAAPQPSATPGGSPQ